MSRRRTDQPKDYSATLIVLAVGGFITATMVMEIFG